MYDGRLYHSDKNAVHVRPALQAELKVSTFVTCISTLPPLFFPSYCNISGHLQRPDHLIQNNAFLRLTIFVCLCATTVLVRGVTLT